MKFSPTEFGDALRSGMTALAVGDPLAAEQAFRAAAQASPRETAAWNNLAIALVSQDRQNEAAEALGRSLDIDPDQPAAWTALATASLAGDRLDAADAACAASLRLDPTAADVWRLQALIHTRQEDFAGASQAYARVCELEGESAEICLQHGVALLKCGRFAEAGERIDRCGALDPQAAAAREIKPVCDLMIVALGEGAVEASAAATLAAAAPTGDQMFKAAFLYLANFGHGEAAARVAGAWVAAFPQDIEARHLRDAATARVAERQPEALVAQHFDAMAEDFDERLVQRLGYRGPERFEALLAAHMTAKGRLDVFDLGCGTGLCAPVLKPYARRLDGIDLSPRMIEKARTRGLYDRLEEADLVATLEGQAGQWDLLLAADTFPYLGDLAPLFDAAARALRPAGWFAFSTEDVEAETYVLKPNGRYGHGQAYIAQVMAGRFALRARETSVLRREGGRAVPGAYYLLQRLA